jgi:phosphoserine phosphatase RsbU/P
MSRASRAPLRSVGQKARKADRSCPGKLNAARRALDEQARILRRLGFLIEASKVLNSTLDLAELLDIILKMTTEQTGAERATLFLVDSARKELWSLLAQGLEQEEIRLPAGRGVAGWVAETGEIVNLSDAHADPRFDPSFDGLYGYHTRTLLAMPVKDRADRIVGVLELLNKKPRFTRADIGLLEGISVHAAIALENARLHRESLERQSIDRDLVLARAIQQRLLPESTPVLDNFDIAVRLQIPLYVGGDYYDFLSLNPSTQLFVVADVEGKGASSAIMMSNLQATLHSLVNHVHSLEGILFHLNEGLQLSTRGAKYMTIFLGLLDLPRRALHYINAGHVPPVVVRADGSSVLLKEGGVVIGLFPGMRYTRGFLQLRSGDVVLACTDGITEAASADDEQYGTERIIRVAAAQRDSSAGEIVDAIFREVAAFTAGGPQPDDKVMMAIRVR